FFLHETCTLTRMLPIGKANFPNNVVDVANDALDNDMSVSAPGLVEKLSKCFLCSVALVLWGHLLLRLDDIFRDFKDFLQKPQTRKKALLVAFFNFFQSSAKCRELGVAGMLP